MRFYLPPDAWSDAQLDEAETYHAKRVLRLQPGAVMTVFDGQGREASATIEAFHKKNCMLRLGPTRHTPPRAVEITLAQAIPKGGTIDFIIQKAVELGAARILPLVTDRTIVRYRDPKEAQAKSERWHSIALEACKQCGQNWMPVIATPCSLQEGLQQINPNDLMLIASLETEALPIKTFFQTMRKTATPRALSATILIGPEGDFTSEEYLLARTSGCQPVSLGPIVLRTETAALYCLSVLAYQLLPS
jgi:16S rRNA (uracil1498-N3)-methyltransferase